MKRFALLAAVLYLATLAAAAPIELPADQRVKNYGRGSCFHAACQDVLKAQGQTAKADYWRKHYRGPATLPQIIAIADRLHLDYALTDSGEEWFLDWCDRTHRGAVIFWDVAEPADHAIVFCGWNAAGDAVLLGVNRPVYTTLDRAAFLAEWRRNLGVAFTFVTFNSP